MKTYELTITENREANSTVAMKATVIMLADLTAEQIAYLNGGNLAEVPNLRARLSSYEQQTERVTAGLIAMITSYLDEHHELEFEDGVNLCCADEEMEMMYKVEGRYYLETTINADGTKWTYDLHQSDLVTVEDLLWIAEQVAYDTDFKKGE